MQEAFGGILNIVIIVVFLVIVEGILGLTVSFTKAFHMKDYIISSIEQYEDSSCTTKSASPCARAIEKKARGLGYPAINLRCPNGFSEDSTGKYFCYKVMKPLNNSGDHVSKDLVYYRVMVQIDIPLPIIRNILSLEFFQIKGDTRVVERPD